MDRTLTLGTYICVHVLYRALAKAAKKGENSLFRLVTLIPAEHTVLYGSPPPPPFQRYSCPERGWDCCSLECFQLTPAHGHCQETAHSKQGGQVGWSHEEGEHLEGGSASSFNEGGGKEGAI